MPFMSYLSPITDLDSVQVTNLKESLYEEG